MSKKDTITRLWNQSMYDFDHLSANLERFYDAARADLEQRLSEADKVINMAKSQLEKRRLYACEGSDSYDPECAEQCIDEAIASIEDYEKGK